MNMIRRTLNIDAGTNARLTEMGAERGQDVAVVLAEAVALLDSVIDIAGPGVAKDRRRLDAFRSNGQAVPLEDVKASGSQAGIRRTNCRVPPRARSDDRSFA